MKFLMKETNFFMENVRSLHEYMTSKHQIIKTTGWNVTKLNKNPNYWINL